MAYAAGAIRERPWSLKKSVLWSAPGKHISSKIADISLWNKIDDLILLLPPISMKTTAFFLFVAALSVASPTASRRQNDLQKCVDGTGVEKGKAFEGMCRTVCSLFLETWIPALRLLTLRQHRIHRKLQPPMLLA